MSNESKHTPTPWNLDGNDIECWIGRSRFYIAECEGEEDAARIVQCVNEYDGLIETIESLRAENAELIEALRSIIAQWDTPNWKLTESTGTIINQARQTLAKYEKP